MTRCWNSPEYGWHLTNLRNYLGLSGAPKLPVTLDGRSFAPLGGGSGLMGLHGDFTPRSLPRYEALAGR